ncbi:F-box/kelch-repeat protein At5g26960 [Selaginella moellendorffii]|nr:F-box/kelch-repeat protein At5g26960 [Selaginella moellendorffii]|eukprot:XP_002970115.2 F-box/kelch-repeat protein At5g26960 [Selaginella moellendorffii]
MGQPAAGAAAAMQRSKSGRRMGLRSLVRACWSPPMSDCECYGDRQEVVVEYSAMLLPPPRIPSPSSSLQSLLMASLPDDLLVECLARVPRGSIRQCAMVCRHWRTIVQSDLYYRARGKLRMLESFVVVFGGIGSGLSSATYSQSTGQWQAGLLFPDNHDHDHDTSSSDHTFIHAQSAVLQHRILVLGATLAGDCTMVYDTWRRTVARAAPMLLPRKKFACCVIGDRVYVAGGASRCRASRDIVMHEAEVYDPELDTWRRLPDMRHRRYGCIGAAVDGIFYVIGGIRRPYAYLSSMDCFDPRVNAWLKSRPLPIGGGCVISCTVVGSCIYMLSSHAVELSFWRYDTRGQAWSRINLPPIPSPLRIDNLLKFSCVTVGSAVHIIQVGGCIDDLLRRGGRNPRGLREGLVLVYDTRGQEWSKAPHLPDMRNGAVCAVVQC